MVDGSMDSVSSVLYTNVPASNLYDISHQCFGHVPTHKLPLVINPDTPMNAIFVQRATWPGVYKVEL